MVIIWSCYHGFEMSDESYYYLGYAYLNDIPDLSGASFHLIFNKFFGLFNLTLPEVRLLRLFLTILAAGVIFLGLEKIIINKNTAEKFILFNVALNGMLLSYTWAPLALSYNSMSSILISLIIGFWLLNMTAHKVYSKVAYSVIIGFLFALLFYVKLTNILLLPIIIISTIYWLNKRKALKIEKIKFVAIYGIAFVVGVLASLTIISQEMSLIIPTMSNYIAETFGIIDNDPSHSIVSLLLTYLGNAARVLIKLTIPLILLFISFFRLKRFLSKPGIKKKSWYLALFKTISAIILIAIVLLNHYWIGGSGTKYQILNSYIFIGVAVFLNQLLENKKVDFILLLGLLSVPTSGAIGTNNGLSAQLLFYGVFVFLVIYLFVYSSKNMWYKYSVLSIIVLLGTSQVISAIVFYPYRQAALTDCDHKLEGVSALEGLKVDKVTYKLREELAFLEKIEAKYVFTYSHQGGMVLLANKIPYALSWFNETSIKLMCSTIDKSKVEPAEIIFLLPSEIPLEDEVIGGLENSKVFFNNDYSIVKQIKYYDEVKKRELTLNIYLWNKE
jgi:hypothetical protein